MKLSLVEHSEPFTLVALVGRLDTPGVDAVAASFNAAVISPRRNAVVDLGGVEFLGSIGVRLLLTAAKSLDRSAARLVLIAAGPLVATALRHSALDDLIPVAADLEGARRLLAAPRNA